MSDAAGLPASFLMSLLPGTRVVEGEGESVAIESPPHLYRPRIALTNVSPGLRGALDRLREAPVAYPALLGSVMQAEGPAGIAKLSQLWKRLSMSALLCYTLDEGGPQATIRPLSVAFRFSDQAIDEHQSVVLSRFAFLRTDQGRMLLECPLGCAELTLCSPQAAAIVHRLSRPATSEQLSAEVPGIDSRCAQGMLTLLAQAQALVRLGDDGVNPEEADPTLAPWEFHDLLFHTRSRLGRHANPYGGTFAWDGKFPSLPAVKEPWTTHTLELARPDLDERAATEPSFTTVLEQRQSIREHADAPIHRDQLAEFLYRVAHVKQYVPEAGVSFRPSPAGGALHELEIYPVVNRCEGLDPGIYHYNPFHHTLGQVAAATPAMRALVQMATMTATMQTPPQILLIVAARFQRLQFKYQSMTYALILKNLGALYQTMYL
ncbi:MAG: SagB family peptide dehydrogenase, partial [Pirellulaceae bacterium]